MKKTLLLFVFLFFANCLFGQEILSPKINKADSVKLSTVWSMFKKSLASKDGNGIKNRSLSLVDCDLFEETISTNTTKDSFIPVGTFIRQFFGHMADSRLWLVVKTRKYRTGLLTAEDFHPRSINLQKSKSLLIYQIWYTTWKPNELIRGHEGQSHAFEFVKINGEFKFYGMTSVP